MNELLAYLGIAFIRLLALLPLSWIRALGRALGVLFFHTIRSRRHIATVNLKLCFPVLTDAQIKKLVREHFVYFMQALLDRSWLWHGRPDVTLKRLKITGAVHELQNNEPVVLFVPHFVGMDAGNTAFTQQIQRKLITIYTNQSNKTIDAWILKRRARFGNIRLFGRIAGVKEIIAALRSGEMLGILPDMNFGPQESIFVPFYGIPTCTIPSLHRFSRLGKAKVVPVINRMTHDGYEVEVLPAWDNFPTPDMVADTTVMNQQLEGYIATMPAQYYWVHKRFKSRPAGAPSVY